MGVHCNSSLERVMFSVVSKEKKEDHVFREAAVQQVSIGTVPISAGSGPGTQDGKDPTSRGLCGGPR
eukprot:5092055-Prorocentrum_lima.AAC.1